MNITDEMVCMMLALTQSILPKLYVKAYFK